MGGIKSEKENLNTCKHISGVSSYTSICKLLGVFDFDNHEKNAEKKDFANTDDTWIEEVEAMRDICTLNGIEPLVERSRSGKGAHIWIFFDKPISAALVRKFGFALLDKGAEQVNLKSFNYYDRMLPAQDSLEMELKTVPWMQLQSIILKLMGVAIILTSCGFYLAGSMTLQNCIGMIICSFLVFESLGSAGNYSTLLRIVDLSVSKVENVMRIKEMDTDGKNIIPKNFDIEVENVDFYYDENHAEDAKIINHLSVHIPERTTTAIVGPSGGGKTTLCHLISRFWDVSNGNISLGGENVRNYSVDSLMKNFSFVFQNVYLFEDTIANNIRFGQPEASMKLVMDAAKKACCHDFIMELPNGYDTVIGEGGTSLSGGEKQRISIARAIMKDAPVIILDEATANVDPENEKELMSAIEALTKEKTIIMIAHRLKTVEHADQILVLDKGQIVQQGRHSELLKQTGIYRKFILEREEAVGWKI